MLKELLRITKDYYDLLRITKELLRIAMNYAELQRLTENYYVFMKLMLRLIAKTDPPRIENSSKFVGTAMNCKEFHRITKTHQEFLLKSK